MNNEILTVHDLKIYFSQRRSIVDLLSSKPGKTVKAVNGVNFSINKQETLGIVGESGSGKTTIGQALVRMVPITAGDVFFEGKNINEARGADSKALCKKIQFIFQDPYSSLNPKMQVLDIVRQPLDTFNLYPRAEREKKTVELLNMVGIATNQVFRYPHEFSGGQRQRICIARALAVQPELIIADEPTSALDVSIQCQILDLLSDLKHYLGLTIIFISHDLGVVNYISDRVLIMYLGRIVETGATSDVLKNPKHPYSKALLDALPKRGGTYNKRELKLEGDIPSPINPPSGCQLHPRCPNRILECDLADPLLRDIGNGHYIACHLMAGNSSV